ncbi:hypothetical protein LV84_00377 [Algoriphagus ratkowskyi]|uniref:DUF1735 domain-containing protein n=1 Tax=Algoriphagus ratkowskyi TaxID=57028 RepID=A0A2W7RGP3_9BACT|nr:hypothetical protein [Algoriphagus ratkowskyi]PZX60108.1 hypothetical protein LV84_00377 [Algoriphagus ratkowskyi]TXD75654.1 hypothetical protein ESW18_19570 [Algoriphagus ratkowskyi]
MKNIKYSFGFLLGALVFLSSCRDFVEPNIPYSEFDTGAYLRTIARTSTTFNFFDLANAKFALTLEAVDAQDGASVETVEIMVQHRRLIPGVGLKYSPAAGPVLIKTIPLADFAPNDKSRFLRTSFEISATEAISKVGLTAADIAGGDIFEFSMILTDKFGRSFNRGNVSNNIAGAPFFDSPFQYFVSVVCPSDLAGTFTYTSTDMDSAYGSCPGTITGSVVLTAVSSSPGAYTVSDGTFGLWNCYGDTWGNGAVRINDACGRLSMSGADKYGVGYSLTVLSVDANNLVFTWLNGDGETGTTTLKSNQGKPWPLNLR